MFLAGPGAHGIEEFAVTDLAGTLGVSERAARMYVGEALELRDRLPRLYAATLAGVLPTWRAREIARQTRTLSPEVAAYVDAHLAPFAHKVNGTRILRAVQAALLHCDPETAKQRAAEAAEKRHVSVEDHLGGISTLTAILRTPDAVALEQRVFIVAEWLALLGDTDSLSVRQSTALALLADPQAALELEQRAWDHVRGTQTQTTETTEAQPKRDDRPGVPAAPAPLRRRRAGISPVVRLEVPRPPPPRPPRRGRAVARRDRTRHHAQAHPRGGRAASTSPSTSTRSHPSSPAKSPRPSTSAPSPGAADADATTSTTSSNTSHPTKADHPARPRAPTSRDSAASTTASRHIRAGPTRRLPDGALHWTSPTAATYRVDPSGTTRL